MIIDGGRYYYGRHRDPGRDYFPVEHATNGKDYRWFREKEDLEVFLVNLPESADRDRLRKPHPDWADATPERRQAYRDEDRASLRAMAGEKVEAGTAPSFSMDLDGEHGPHPPRRVPAAGGEHPRDRLERQVAEYKAMHAPPVFAPDSPAGRMGGLARALLDDSWQDGLSEAGKLRVLEGNMDWAGVDPSDKEAILRREVDFARVTRKQFDFVYRDIASDNFEPADPAVALKLFEKANPGDLAKGPRAGSRQGPGLRAGEVTHARPKIGRPPPCPDGVAPRPENPEHAILVKNATLPGGGPDELARSTVPAPATEASIRRPHGASGPETVQAAIPAAIPGVHERSPRRAPKSG